MAFRRVRRRYMEARKVNKVKPIIEELLQAIEGNGMTVRAWFEAMDLIAINNMVTQCELSQGMRMLLVHSVDRKKQPVLTPEKVGGFVRETTSLCSFPSFCSFPSQWMRGCPPFQMNLFTYYRKCVWLSYRSTQVRVMKRHTPCETLLLSGMQLT